MAEGNEERTLIELCKQKLEMKWSGLRESEPVEDIDIPAEIINSITQSINAKTKSYRYVLPTQILAKSVDHSLDCRSIQAGSGLRGAFDARSVCHKVIVPFDRNNECVLGGSAEPYVNNPIRIPAIRGEFRSAQKKKDEFDHLIKVLAFAEDNHDLIDKLLWAVLVEIKKRLSEIKVTYSVPNRASTMQVLDLLQGYLSERTGGLRLQVLSTALFRSIGEAFNLWSAVQSNVINAADASTGSAADIECIDQKGLVLLAVEVKDRKLELRHVQDALPKVREKGIRELIFLIQNCIKEEDKENIESILKEQFTSGQNLYVEDFFVFARVILSLMGEVNRRKFLEYVGEELEDRGEDYKHKKYWSDLLSRI